MSPALFVLNFYSPIFVDQLKRGRKTATIRLGDKSRKYKRGQVVWITVGYRHQPREKIFAAVIDDVEVKKVSGALAARHRARQPGVPPAARRPSTSSSRSTPVRSRGRHGHGDPLLADRRAPEHAVRQRRAALAELIRAGPARATQGDGRVPLPHHLAARGRARAGLGRDLRVRALAASGGTGVLEAEQLEEGDESGVGQVRPLRLEVEAPLQARVLRAHHPGRAAPPARGRRRAASSPASAAGASSSRTA